MPGWSPGCPIRVSGELATPLTHGCGTARVEVLLPDDTSLLGARYFNQAIAFDPGANPLGITVSNGIRLQLGGL